MPRFPFLILSFALCACGQPDSASTLTVVDDAERPVAIPREVVKVVSLAPNVTELAFAAGVGPRLAAVTTADDFPPAVHSLAKVQALPVNFEAIVALQPNLVLASTQVNNPRDAETLAQLGVATYFTRVRTLEDVPRVITDLGELFGTSAAATRAVADWNARLAAFSGADDAAPSVLFLIGDETLFSFGPESYVHDMIRLAGGRSLTQSLQTEAPVLSEEYVLQSAPDVIIGAFGSEYSAADLLAKHPSWDSVPAIRSGRVFGLNPDWVLRPGPRLALGVAEMARLIAGAP